MHHAVCLVKNAHHCCWNHRVSSSGYSYRSEIKRLVELLGGTWTESFSRRNTHLLVSRAEGTKYNAAGRWGVVCLRVEWLLDCALQGQVRRCVHALEVVCSTHTHSCVCMMYFFKGGGGAH